MDGMQRVYEFLKDAGTYYIATIDAKLSDTPRVRPFGTVNLFEGKLYIQTGKLKPTAKQLLQNPKAEICAFKDGIWVRIAATLLPDERVEAKKSMLDAYPELRGMYDENDRNTIVFYLTNASATFSSFAGAPQYEFFGLEPMKSIEEVTGNERVYPLHFIWQNAYHDLKYPTHQTDGKTELGEISTFGSSGCGLASAMMLVEYLCGEKFTAEEAIRLALESGSSPTNGTYYVPYSAALAERFGLFTKITNSEEELSAWLSAGNVAVAHCKNYTGDVNARVFTANGHYIALVGETNDGRPIALDPSYTPVKYEDPERKKKVELVRGENAIFTLVSYETLAEETTPTTHGKYYLFSKK